MSEQASQKSVRDYLIYTLSLPERALRTTSGVAGGAIRESAALLVPQAFQDSKTYGVLVGQTLKFLCENVGGVQADPEDEEPVVVPLNEANPTLGRLDPPHSPRDRRPRLEISFGVNSDRWLIASVEDLRTKKMIMNEEAVVRLL